MKEPEDKQVEQEPSSNRLRKYAAITLFALLVVVAIDGYFSNWSIVRTLISLNTLTLRDKADHSWDLLSRKDFQLVKVNDVRTIIDTDSLLRFDKPYRAAGYYRLYFRSSDSSSANLQKLYQALLSLDTTQTIQRTVQDAQRAYENLGRILRLNRPVARDTINGVQSDSAMKIARGDVALGNGDETMAVVKKIMADPHVLAGVGIGIVASAGIDLLRGNAYLAIAKEDVFRLDSIKVGSRVGSWEGSPIDIVWAFARVDTAAVSGAHVQAQDSVKK